MIKRECVDQEGWISEEQFKQILAVYQVLPGPEAHELCVYFGRERAGKIGGFLAGLGFMLPGFLLMLGLSVAYVQADLGAELDDLFYGLKAAVAALVAAGLLYELWTGRERWSSRASSFGPAPLLAVAVAGTVTLSPNAEIFL